MYNVYSTTDIHNAYLFRRMHNSIKCKNSSQNLRLTLSNDESKLIHNQKSSFYYTLWRKLGCISK